jgi:alkylation response protein AidB-like acyl-CoA dehydrogenase
VDLTLDDNQVTLQTEIRRLLSRELSPERRRELMELPGAVDRALWSKLADMGVFSLIVPESDDYPGLGLADAVIVFEELGRALAPGPLVATFLAAGLLDGAADGSRIVGAFEFDADVDGDSVIEHLDALDDILVIGQDVRSVPAPDGRSTRRPLDPLTPIHHLDSATLRGGTALGGSDLAFRLHLVGGLLTAALHVGIAQTSVDLGVSYAKQRQQFGRPIGGFQAVKHQLADAASWTEVARAGVHAAAVTIDEDASQSSNTHHEPDAAATDVHYAVACARLCASRAAHRAASTCIQVHGGMGYTWEIEAHLLLKRSMVLDESFGGLQRCERLIDTCV